MDSAIELSREVSEHGSMRLCVYCHKPFLKETSYTRHISYCRHAQSRPRTRTRSCRACSNAKVKCSFQSRCSRCASKNLECIYDTHTAAPTCRDHVTHHHTMQELTPVFSPDPLAVGDLTGTLDNLFPCGREMDTDNSQVDFDWDSFGLASTGVLPPSPSRNLHQFQENPSKSMRNRILSHEDPESRNIMENMTSSSAPDNYSLTKLPESTETTGDDSLSANFQHPSLWQGHGSDLLAWRPHSDPVSQFTAKVVMQMLRAFPQMMLRRETLPPFIHGHWYHSTTNTELRLPEPIVNCMGIAQVFASHNSESKSFLWRTIKMEGRSMIEKASKHQRQFSRHELLAAVQVQLIYVIMRVTDGSKLEPELNVEMLLTHQILCEAFRDFIDEDFCQDEREFPSSNWEDWIFAESRRRTIHIWLLISQTLSVKVATPCYTVAAFRSIPLCAPKSLWEAKTRSAWQAEYEIYKRRPRMGLEVYGDLIDASKQRDGGSNSWKLDAWNAAADNLGVLLSFGAEMIQNWDEI